MLNRFANLYLRDRGFVSVDCVCMEYKAFVWAAKLKTTIFYDKFYIDIPSSILNIISVNVHLFRKSQTSQNSKHYLHRKYRSDLATVKNEASEARVHPGEGKDK